MQAKIGNLLVEDVRSLIAGVEFPLDEILEPKGIADHHAAAETTAEAIARYHVLTKGWGHIGYHFVIERDGTIKYTLDLKSWGYHAAFDKFYAFRAPNQDAKYYNRYYIAICLAGDLTVTPATPAQMSALYRLIRELARVYSIPNDKILGHRDLPGWGGLTECPGFNFKYTEVPMQKFGPHSNAIRDYNRLLEIYKKWQPPWGKFMDNALNLGLLRDIKNSCPNTKIIYRLYEHNQIWTDDPIGRGRAFADRVFADFLRMDKLFDACESYNEFLTMLNPGEWAAGDTFMAAFYDRIMELNAQNGTRLDPAAFGLNVGNLDGDIIVKNFPKAVARYKLYSLHEYDAPAMWTVHRDGLAKGNGGMWTTLHYRRIMPQIQRVKPDAQCIITECGIDGGVIGPLYAGKGWKSFVTKEQYLEQLAWYNSELQKDDYVLGATIFGVSNDAMWEDFEIFEEDYLINGIANLDGTPPSPSDNSYRFGWESIRTQTGESENRIYVSPVTKTGAMVGDVYLKVWAGDPNIDSPNTYYRDENLEPSMADGRLLFTVFSGPMLEDRVYYVRITDRNGVPLSPVSLALAFTKGRIDQIHLVARTTQDEQPKPLDPYVEWYDSRLPGLGVTLKRATPKAGQMYNKVVRVEYMDPEQAGGRRAIYFQVLDGAKNQVAGIQGCKFWPDGQDDPRQLSRIAANWTDWANSQLDAGYNPPTPGPYGFFVGDENTEASDQVLGMGLPMKQHVAFCITVQRYVYQSTEPPAPPEPPKPPEPPIPDEPSADDLENAAWNAMGVDRNPDAALYKEMKARHWHLLPLCNEYRWPIGCPNKVGQVFLADGKLVFLWAYLSNVNEVFERVL